MGNRKVILWEALILLLGLSILLSRFQPLLYGQNAPKKNDPKIIKLLNEANDLSKKYDYTAAVLKCTEALKAAESNREVANQVSDRLDDIKKEETLFQDFLIKIKGQTVSLPRLGLNGAVLTPTNESCCILGTVTKWSSLNPDEIYTLYKTAFLHLSEPEGVSIFCLEHGLMDGVFDTFNRIIQKSSNRKSELDNLLSRYTGRQIPPGGFIVYKNKWLTPEEKAVLVTRETVLALAQKIGLVNKQFEMEQITQEFRRLILANPAQSAELNEIIVKALRQKSDDLKKVLPKRLPVVGPGQLTELKKELDKKRKEALKEIQNGRPDPPADHPATSKEMDKKVSEVRALWEKPLEMFIQSDKTLAPMIELMRALAAELKKYNTAPGSADDDVDIFISTLTARTNADTKAKLLLAADKKTMEANETNKLATDDERETVRIHNEYRMMMGLNALKIDDRLTRAARKHSEYMQSTNQFAHEGIGDGDMTGRLRAQGYTGMPGENISQGRDNPRETFDGWYWSYGHHKNIIDSWTLIGVGISEKYYTTNFGR